MAVKHRDPCDQTLHCQLTLRHKEALRWLMRHEQRSEGAIVRQAVDEYHARRYAEVRREIEAREGMKTDQKRWG